MSDSISRATRAIEYEARENLQDLLDSIQDARNEMKLELLRVSE